jgi:branched-chain amino acid transport system permease protein
VNPILVRRVLAPLGGSSVLFAALVVGTTLYAAGGGSSRDNLVTQLLVNAIVVIGIQVFVGNTGVLSFGHVAFAGLAAYVFALFAISSDRKATIITDAPFGIADIDVSPLVALLVAIAVCTVVAVVLGLGLVRSGAQSGAVAATVITLALLFVVHEVAVNWTELTGGDRAGLSFSIGDTLTSLWPVYVALFLSIVAARLFAETRVGWYARASRDDVLAARAMGINPAVPQMVALIVSVVIVAVGGSLRVYELGTVTPKFFFLDYTLLTLTMLIVGGRRSVTGALAGTVVITAGNELARYLAGPEVNVPGMDWLFRDGLSEIFLGGAMLGFMILRPKGLLDDWELDRWWSDRWRRARESRPAVPPAAPVPDPATLSVANLTVRFGGFTALQKASMAADNRHVLGLIGPNGAGKTTLLNVVTGVVEPQAGSVLLDDLDVTGSLPHQLARLGLVRTFQNLRLFSSLTVRDNIGVAAQVGEQFRPGWPRPTVEELLVLSQLWEHRDRRARELDYGNSRRLELARAAAVGPVFLLLDEPTSGMSESESLEMINRVRDMAAAVAAGVIVIDHDLGFITGICETITCLDQGSVIAVGTPAEIQADAAVRAAYLGSRTPA